jgi:hypothetical protein
MVVVIGRGRGAVTLWDGGGGMQSGERSGERRRKRKARENAREVVFG